MPKLIMLVGLPGSGKSTFSEHFLGDRLSTDYYIEWVAKSTFQTYNQVFESNITQAKEWMKNRMYYALHHESNIIWDQTNLTKKTRASKLAKIPYDYEKICFFFDTPFETILKRNEERKLTGRNIPDTVLLQMKNSLQIPTVDEGFDRVCTIKGE